MNLVVGATGLLGGEICRRLKAQGESVRAIIRPTAGQDRRKRLEDLGVELIPGDLKNRQSLSTACRNVAAVTSTASSMLSQQAGDTIQTVDLEGQINLIEAAKEAGVPRFTYISVSANIDVECPLILAKHAVERHLQASGLNYTILRPGCFMEVWLSPAVGFDIDRGRVQVAGAGTSRISWISLEDVAQFAVECLGNPVARQAIIELGGPRAISPLDVVKIFESLSGRVFEVQHASEEVLQTQIASAPDPIQQSLLSLMLACSRGDEIDMESTTQAFRVRLTSVEEYARRVSSS